MHLQGEKLEGRLVRWNDDRGFGFIQVVGQQRDVFLHISQLGKLPRRPEVGDRVDFELGMDGQGRLRAECASIQGLAKVNTGSSYRSGRKRSYEIQGKKLGIFAWLLLLAPAAFSFWVLYRDHNVLPLLIYLFMSLFTFIAYAMDKKKAIDKEWRTQESFLHFMELLGGWPGGLLAQYKIRHKSRKRSYQVIFWIIVCLHLALWLDYLLFSGRWMWHPAAGLAGAFFR